MAQCNDCETKTEYDRSTELLFKLLNLKETKDVLSKDCKNAIVRLQNNLAARINKYDGFVRIAVKNCMDAMTTSPAKSQNNMLKSGLNFVSNKIPLDKAITRIVNHTVKRLRRRRCKALAEKTTKNTASRGPTRYHFIRKGQGLVDRNHDQRLHMQSAQTSPKSWMVWNCNKIDHVELEDPLMLNLPQFIWVRTMSLATAPGGTMFVPCSCHWRDREGVPCFCFFKICDDADIMFENIVDLGMIDPHYYKLYNSHYGEDNKNGRLMYKAQKRSLKTEGLGTMIMEETSNALTGSLDDTYPILGKNTTMADLVEAKFVMGSQCPCTVLKLERWRDYVESDKSGSDNDMPDKTPLAMLDTYAFFSEEAKKMKEALQQSALEPDVPSDRLSALDERQVMCNDIMQKLNHVQDDCRIRQMK